MRPFLALLVLILDVVAIVSILGARRTARRRLVWTVAVVLLPGVGALGWLLVGRTRTPTMEVP
jgi:hypothetical protein